MAETKIPWTNFTVNFWHGCKKVSEGCKYCYMFRDKAKYGQNGNVIQKRDFKKIRKELDKLSTPHMIFTCSWSDFFIEEADKWRDEAWKIIEDYPQHTWQILTKRPERIPNFFKFPDNVWIGVSAENQKTADERITTLLMNANARIYFASLEPLLSGIELTKLVNINKKFPLQGDSFNSLNGKANTKIDIASYGIPGIRYRHLNWVVVGGESGNDIGKFRYRPCSIDWICKVIYDCNVNNVRVFVKQLGRHLAKELNLKHIAGGDIEEFPMHYLKKREFPL